MGRTVGVVVAGVAPDHRLPLEYLGLPADVALAPFGVRHRLLDVAVSTLQNSGIRDLEIAVAGAAGPSSAYRFSVASSPGPQRLPRVRETAPPAGGRLGRMLAATREGDDFTVAGALVAAGRVAAADLGRDAYWHDPVSSEAYYEAHMALCLPSPPLDLWNPAWPIRAGSVGAAPAKIVADVGGHPGHVLNALLGDGSCVRGAEVVRCVLGSGVVIETGAEVEDALLLDGCRIGRGARVRRAIVGVGAVIGDGEIVGYDESSPSMRVLPSGLTLVPPAATTLRPAAHGR
jgi:ADP-glucose pyrophosphorylase